MAKKRQRRAPRPPTAADAGAPQERPSLIERAGQVRASAYWRFGLPAVLALLGLTVGSWTFDAKLSRSGDNAEFITLARSLARGQGLSYIHLPEARPATKYPFGFPLMLAPLAASEEQIAASAQGGEPIADWIAMKWLVVALFAASAPLLYLLVRREAGEAAALAVTALAITNPLLAEYGHQVMSEIPYLAFSLAALLLLQRGLEEGRREWNGWLIGGFALALWAYYVRSVGVALLGALLVHLAWRREWRRAGAAFGATVLGLLPWVLRNRAVGGGSVYLKQLIQVNPYFPDRGLLDLSTFWARISMQVRFHLQHGLPEALIPSLGYWASPISLASLVLLALAGGAVALCLRRDCHRLLLIYCVFLLATVVLWPWPGYRFLVPAVPLLLFFIVRVMQELLGQADRIGGRPAAVVFAGAAVAALLWGNAGLLSGLARQGDADYPPQWRNYYAAAQWLRANTSPDAVVCARKPFWLHVTSGRRVVPYRFVEPEELLQDLDDRGVSYVVLEQLGFRQTRMFLAPAVQAKSELFEPVWRMKGPDTYVLTYRGPS